MTKDNGNGVSQKVQIAVMAEKIINIEKTVNQIELNQRQDYTPLTRFTPVEKIAYAMVGLILLSVVGALINLVIKK